MKHKLLKTLVVLGCLTLGAGFVACGGDGDGGKGGGGNSAPVTESSSVVDSSEDVSSEDVSSSEEDSSSIEDSSSEDVSSREEDSLLEDSSSEDVSSGVEEESSSEVDSSENSSSVDSSVEDSESDVELPRSEKVDEAGWNAVWSATKTATNMVAILRADVTEEGYTVSTAKEINVADDKAFCVEEIDLGEDFGSIIVYSREGNVSGSHYRWTSDDSVTWELQEESEVVPLNGAWVLEQIFAPLEMEISFADVTYDEEIGAYLWDVYGYEIFAFGITDGKISFSYFIIEDEGTEDFMSATFTYGSASVGELPSV